MRRTLTICNTFINDNDARKLIFSTRKNVICNYTHYTTNIIDMDDL